MPTSEASPLLTGEIQRRVTTRAEVESPITRDFGRDASARDRWQNVIDQYLIEWGRHPAELEDDGVDPPSGETIRKAVDLAKAFRDAGLPAPDSVVPDPNGGIVFEVSRGETREQLRVWDDGSIEYVRMEGARLVERMPLL